ncbi:MAG: 5'/3'-nucleotidase SurE [Candidatus Aminicenantaceae bacterium]
MDDKRPLILLTNDDGFYAEGIQSLFECLQDVGADVYIVAPDREQSATSLALTLHHPLRVKTIRDRVFAVDGTPTDCVYLAVRKLLSAPPDLIISGINRGPNLGQQDISYSGTVGGAVQGTFLQICSLAVSHLPDSTGTYHFDFCSKVVRSLSRDLLEHPLPEGITLNINIPAPPVKGLRLAKLGEKRYHPEIVVKTDPRGRDYYWIGTGTPQAIGDAESDVILIQEEYITVTPIHQDRTAYPLLETRVLERVLNKVYHEIIS